MSDRFAGYLTIPVWALEKPEVLEVFKDYFGPFSAESFLTENQVDEQGWTLEEDQGIKLIKFHDYQARDGQFEDLEELLVQEQVPFDRVSDHQYEYNAERVVFRPDLHNPESNHYCYYPLVELGGDDMVSARELRQMLDKGLEAVKTWIENTSPAYPSIGEWCKATEFEEK
jgi:hypothetical protein